MSRIVFAPDSFKGSLDALAVAQALAEGWREHDPAAELVLRPMADGGEGTVACFALAEPAARRMPVEVRGPDGRNRKAEWLLLPGGERDPGGVGVVELANTSGIELLGERRLPDDADTTCFGQAIEAALDHSVSRLVLGIGSSASTDGGLGLLRALGATFTDAAGAPVAPGARGLASLAAADLSGLRPLPDGGASVITDVTNPLLGPEGAAAVFGPQKGLDADGVQRADEGLRRFADLLGGDPGEPGAGAAGGTGFALRLWGAQLAPGAEAIAGLIRLREAVAGADLVVTGEGQFDTQSLAGKVPGAVAAIAREAGVHAAVVAGRIAPGADSSGFAHALSLTELAGSPQQSMAEPARWLRRAGALLAEATTAR
ncbi:glycerate kinase [Herbiconiux sp.]|uniref:glycerate kinase n=1 Tax=Herbiconiux sp. TaxID=1871186 RepID=UPI0025C17648|nr:glycerate kinase [Herbiconiux sp.]